MRNVSNEFKVATILYSCAKLVLDLESSNIRNTGQVGETGEVQILQGLDL